MELDEFFGNGNWELSYNGINGIDHDALVEHIEGFSCTDSNGCDPEAYWQDENNDVHVIISYYDRVFENGTSYQKKTYEIVGRLEEYEENDLTYGLLHGTQLKVIKIEENINTKE